jgi:HAD superfamily hydrolase (TIGR01509 family)
VSQSIQAVIFDFDGTLADTFPAIHSAFNAALEPVLGRTYTRDEVIDRFGPHDEGMLKIEMADHLDQFDETVEIYFQAYTDAHDDGVVAFEGITELLEELDKRGYRLACMTGKGRRAADISLEYLGWTKRFEVVVAGEEVDHPKPAPDGPLLAAKLLGVAPEHCIYVGDSPADLGASRAAGIKGVVAGWHTYFEALLHEMQPERWANTPADVLKYVVD